jgi:hypothetical protein
MVLLRYHTPPPPCESIRKDPPNEWVASWTAKAADRRYYHPTSEGREKLLKQRMDEIERIREENRKRE